MGEMLTRYNRELAENKPVHAILAGLALTTALSGGVVAVRSQGHHSAGSGRSALEAVNARLVSQEQADAEARHLAQLRHRRHEARVKEVRESVPQAALTAAVVQSKGNLMVADRHLQAHHLPPLTVEQAQTVTKQLRFRFSAHDRLAVAQVAERWDETTPDTQLTPVAQPAVVMKQLLGELSGHDVTALRAGIVAEARSYLGVHEAHGGCNCGPQVNQFTLGHHEFWCSDWYTYVYMKRGLNFTGGETLGREDWQIPRVLINSHSPQVMSLEAWFKDYGEYFQAADHLPRPGDAILEQWPGGSHVMMVAEVLPGNHLLAIGGNMDNAVEEKIISAHDPLIAGFGSYFKQ